MSHISSATTAAINGGGRRSSKLGKGKDPIVLRTGQCASFPLVFVVLASAGYSAFNLMGGCFLLITIDSILNGFGCLAPTINFSGATVQLTVAYR